MAKCIAPAMSVETRGKVSGLIFNTTRGIRYIKSFTSPSQPRTARQLTIRSYAVRMSRAWQSLGAAARATWTAYANTHTETDWTNTPRRLTGANWYTRCNVRLLDMGQTETTTAPETVAPDPIQGLAVAPITEGISISFTTEANTLSVGINLQGPVSPGQIARFPRSKHHSYAPAETSPVEITDLQAGQYHVWAQAIDESNGLTSTWGLATAYVS